MVIQQASKIEVQVKYSR